MTTGASKSESKVAALLAELIGYDTRNPEGDELPLARRLADELRRRSPDSAEVVEVPREGGGSPRAYVMARWGTPKTLVNVHFDTVPANAGWTSDPHVAKLGGGRVVGLGAADTKGAIAAILCALDEATPRDTAIVFSGDEEHTGTVMRAFVASPHARGIERAVVCEPTRLRAGTRHRGILALDVARRGAGGHSSAADRMPAPIADLSRVAVAVDDWARAQRGAGPRGFEGMCVNVARLAGGVAFNVVPDSATLSFSLRPPPGADLVALEAELRSLVERALPAEAAGHAQTRTMLANPSFATRDLAAYRGLLGDDIAAAPVDMAFWTEAAVLSAAGIDAVVFGPGDIAQAHAPDEWVLVDELEGARAIFARMFHGGSGSG
jgi:acetylornithine deacetylase